MWTRNNLQDLIRQNLGDYRFITVSNRQPVIHSFKHGKVEMHRTPGGVVTALDPVMRACQGTWIAYGNGDADKKASDASGKIKIPVDNPAYTLKRVWLTKEEAQGYYNGYSNQALWPLCHMAFQRPVFREDDWKYYVQVNRKFAEAVVQESAGRKAFVWIQDYHLCLLPKFLKEMAGDRLISAHFWHIPWPGYEVFRVCRYRKEILEGLLANDLIGFQIMYHCNNFIDVVNRELECKIDRERFSIVRGGRETVIRSFPISVDFQDIQKTCVSREMKALEKKLIDEFALGKLKVLLAIERIDYTKGIPEKLLAIDYLFEKYPQLKKKAVFVYKGAVSRIHVPLYKELNSTITSLVEEINWKHSLDGWKPIVNIGRDVTYQEILALYRIADTCIVSSLHDGMNLVAKEFVAARTDEDGMLVLSQFTGSSREFTDAVLINPYDREEFGEGIYQALVMSQSQRRRRMGRMRKIIKKINIYYWAGKIISELFKIETPEEEV